MALHFVSAGARAPHSDETLGPTATRGSSHSARRLRSLAFLCSSIEHLRERTRELEVHLAKDSHNPSRPPSSDSPFRKPPPRSQRQPSGHKPSGQPGRRGVTRSLGRSPRPMHDHPVDGNLRLRTLRHRDRGYSARGATPSGRGEDPA